MIFQEINVAYRHRSQREFDAGLGGFFAVMQKIAASQDKRVSYAIMLKLQT